MKKISAADTHKQLDLEELLIIMTVAGGCDSLPSQFMNTITLAEIAIKKAEVTHPKLIAGGWRHVGYITEDSTLDRRAIYLLDYEKQKEALLPLLYYNVLSEFRKLRDMTKIAVGMTEEPSRVFDLKKYMENRLSPPAWPSMDMLNKITPCIFSMFMQATRLIGNIDNRSAVTNLITVEQRTKMGGQASNHGQEVLIKYFTEAIRSLPSEPKTKSLNELFRNNFDFFQEKLNIFQTNRFQSNENKPVTAGSKLNSEGLYNAFRRWSNKDSEFLSAIQDKVPSFKLIAAV